MKTKTAVSTASPILLLLAASLAHTQPAAAPLTVGVAGAVRGQVMAVAAQFGAAGRVLESGKLVFYKDTLTTGPRAGMQVMLIDETVFTLGPDTEMVVDEFVYNPKNHDGKVAVRLTKGVMRFVTGKVAKKKPSNMRIRLPIGTIGIRGTIAAARIDGGVIIVALLGPGPKNNAGERRGGISVSHMGNTVEIWKTGFGTLLRAGYPPLPPFQLSPEQMGRLDPTVPLPSDLKDALKDSVTEIQDGEDTVGDDGQTASEQSGQNTVAALGDLSDTESLGAFSGELDDEIADITQSAAAGGIADGIAQWRDVRSIDSGQGQYSGSGSGFNLTQCNGGACSGTQTGTMTVALNIDFGARTLGGDCGGSCGASSISLSAQDNPTETFISDFLTVPETSFSSLNGDAVLSVNSANTDATVSLLNSGGQAATSALIGASYDDGFTQASGSLTLPLQEGSVAPPCQQCLQFEVPE